MTGDPWGAGSQELEPALKPLTGTRNPQEFEMSDVAEAQRVDPEVIHPPAISLSELWPWTLFGVALMLLIYFVGVDEGAASVIPGATLRELVHDGRHLLGFPSH